jgi:hypothetical protein
MLGHQQRIYLFIHVKLLIEFSIIVYLAGEKKSRTQITSSAASYSEWCARYKNNITFRCVVMSQKSVNDFFFLHFLKKSKFL